MAKKYRRSNRTVTRLEKQEAKRLMRQTYLIIAAIILLILGIIFVGIPALIKIAVFLGDIRASSTPITQEDTIPPATPQMTTPPTATTSAKINLSGYAEASSTVELYQNNSQVNEVLTDTNGTFEFISIALDPGTNRFYIKAVDAAGNQSPPSPVNTVIFDPNAPTINLDQPDDGQQFFGPSEQKITIKGNTDSDTTIKVNDRLAVVDSNGNFSLNYQLSEGDNRLTITATDKAGNTTTQEVSVKFTP